MAQEILKEINVGTTGEKIEVINADFQKIKDFLASQEAGDYLIHYHVDDGQYRFVLKKEQDSVAKKVLTAPLAEKLGEIIAEGQGHNMLRKALKNTHFEDWLKQKAQAEDADATAEAEDSAKSDAKSKGAKEEARTPAKKSREPSDAGKDAPSPSPPAQNVTAIKLTDHNARTFGPTLPVVKSNLKEMIAFSQQATDEGFFILHEENTEQYSFALLYKDEQQKDVLMLKHEPLTEPLEASLAAQLAKVIERKKKINPIKKKIFEAFQKTKQGKTSATEYLLDDWLRGLGARKMLSWELNKATESFGEFSVTKVAGKLEIISIPKFDDTSQQYRFRQSVWDLLKNLLANNKNLSGKAEVSDSSNVGRRLYRLGKSSKNLIYSLSVTDVAAIEDIKKYIQFFGEFVLKVDAVYATKFPISIKFQANDSQPIKLMFNISKDRQDPRSCQNLRIILAQALGITDPFLVKDEKEAKAEKSSDQEISLDFEISFSFGLEASADKIMQCLQRTETALQAAGPRYWWLHSGKTRSYGFDSLNNLEEYEGELRKKFSDPNLKLMRDLNKCGIRLLVVDTKSADKIISAVKQIEGVVQVDQHQIFIPLDLTSISEFKKKLASLKAREKSPTEQHYLAQIEKRLRNYFKTLIQIKAMLPNGAQSRVVIKIAVDEAEGLAKIMRNHPDLAAEMVGATKNSVKISLPLMSLEKLCSVVEEDNDKAKKAGEARQTEATLSTAFLAATDDTSSSSSLAPASISILSASIDSEHPTKEQEIIQAAAVASPSSVSSTEQKASSEVVKKDKTPASSSSSSPLSLTPVLTAMPMPATGESALAGALPDNKPPGAVSSFAQSIGLGIGPSAKQRAGLELQQAAQNQGDSFLEADADTAAKSAVVQ